MYDGWNLIAERVTPVGEAETVTRYVCGLDLSQSVQGAGGIGGLLLQDTGTATWLYTYEANGNVGQLVDGTTGAVVAHYEYDPFGTTLTASGTAADANPFRFSTKYTDADTTLLYYGYRFYAPTLGRWLTRDPLGEAGGVNVYGFLSNTPINTIDVLGLRVCPCKCDETQEDLQDALNTYINDLIEQSERNLRSVHSKIVPTANMFLKHITGIETWISKNHQRNLRGKDNEKDAPCMRLCGECVGLDKIGHFFEEGWMYRQIALMTGDPKYATGFGEWAEGLAPKDPEVLEWLKTAKLDFLWSAGLYPIKVYNVYGSFGDGTHSANKLPSGKADLEANLQGYLFWDEFARAVGNDSLFTFDICKYVNAMWDENKNPNVPMDVKP